jgi:hypothetical protein
VMKEILRIDTDEKLEVWKKLVGTFTCLGFRKRPPTAPKLNIGKRYAHFDLLAPVKAIRRGNCRIDLETGHHIAG